MTRPGSALAVCRTVLSVGLAAVVLAGGLPVPRAVSASPAITIARTSDAPPSASDTGITIAPPVTIDPPDAAPVDDQGPGVLPDAASIGDQGAGAMEPSIVYQEAMAHEQDRIAFVPGGRVSVGFRPRADDQWPVDGAAPTALPAGRATGRQMAASPQGSDWAPAGKPLPPLRSPEAGTPPAPGTGAGLTGHGATVAWLREPGDAGPTATTLVAGAQGQPGASTTVAYLAPQADPSATTAASLAPPADPTADPAAASSLRRQVFGFLPYWALPGASTRLNEDVLSTIAYFSVGADGAGNLGKRTSGGSRTTGWAGWTSSDMTSVISDAHRHGTRVVLTISVFAWTGTQAATQRALLGSAGARLRLARQAAAAVRDRGADGINLDFEPLARGYESQFVALLRTIRAELNRIRSGYQLTYDTTGFIGNYPLEASVARGAADAVFVMGYDYRTAGSSTAGSVDPLSGPTYDLADTVRAYTARISPSRLILGIPWYGRAWSTSSSAVRAKNVSGARYGYSTAVSYATVADLVARYGRRWDSVEQSPYVVYRRRTCTSRYGCVTAWRQVYYDDAASMRLRYALVNDYGLRGAGIWALGYDGGRSELYRALSVSFLVDKSAPQAGIVMLPTTARDEGFVVRWTARDVSRVVRYDVQVSVDGGPWTAWLTGTRASSDVWLGANGHGYAFRVRATDSKGNRGSWNTTSTWSASLRLAVGGFGRVTRDGLAYRAGPDVSSARLGTLGKGTIVALTRGPVRSGGYTWWEVTQPIREWNPVSFVERGVWVASESSSRTYVVPFRAPNSTTVDAGLRGLAFGGGTSMGVGSSAAAIAARSFSPNGDGSGDTLQLRWTNTVALDSLSLQVYRSDGSLVGTRTVPATGRGARSWGWNGRIGKSAVSDGRYLLRLVGVVGGQVYSAPSARPVTPAQVAAYGVVVDRVAPRITRWGASRTLLSPNGDGQRDAVAFSLSSTGATRWAVSIANAAGSTVRTATGRGRSLGFTWTGTDDRGRRVPDGRYTATLRAYDDAGNSAGPAIPLTVDTTPPLVTTTASPGAFSPNGDHALEDAVLAWVSNETAWGTARVWQGTRLVRSWPVSGRRSGSLTWNGRDAAGRPVPDGRYRFEVRVRDAGRNWTTATTRVVVDRTASSLRWSGSFYPQDGDALARTSRLSWTLSRPATVTLRLYDAGGRLVRTVWSGRALAAGAHHWTWNGTLANGSYVPPGLYRAGLTVSSRLGTVDLRQDVWVTPFRVQLSATTVRPGQTLGVDVLPVEPLGARPVVSFRQPGRTAVTARATPTGGGWYRVRFTVRPGSSGIASITITARDAQGQRNRLTVPVRVHG